VGVIVFGVHCVLSLCFFVLSWFFVDDVYCLLSAVIGTERGLVQRRGVVVLCMITVRIV